MPIVRPRSLSTKSRIGVFLPSEPIGPARLDRFMVNAARFEQVTGLQVVLPSEGVLRSSSLYRAPAIRAAEVHTMLSDPLIDGLIAGWGGKSCNELLPHLDYKLIAEKRKVIVGFSDVGVLSNAIATETGLVGFYGPNVLGKLDESSQPGWDLLLDSRAWMRRPLLSAETVGPPSVAQFAGTLVGGNLSTFTVGLSGTQWLPRQGHRAASPRVFFFEGTERVQVQRQLIVALLNQGFFEDVTGIVIGRSPRTDDRWSADQLETLADVLPSNLPLAIVDNFGHADLPNPILPIGAAVEVSVQGGVCTIRATEPIVEETLSARSRP